MRLPLIALLVVASASPLAAQWGRGPDNDPKPAQTPAARTRPDPNQGPNVYNYPRYRVLVPRLTMDSVTSIVETRYEGWHVDSKVLSHERGHPIYILGMVAGGFVGTRLVVVDGDTGEVVNPEVMGDSTASGRAPQRTRYRTGSATSHP